MNRRRQSSAKAWRLKAQRFGRHMRREFGALISVARKDCGVSWREVAAHSGIDEARVRGIAAGDLDPTLSEAAQISEGLNVGFSIVLVGGAPTPPRRRGATGG